MRLLEFKRTKLFDGIEDGLFDKDFQLNIEGKSVLFIVDDITPHKLIELRSGVFRLRWFGSDGYGHQTGPAILSGTGWPELQTQGDLSVDEFSR